MFRSRFLLLGVLCFLLVPVGLQAQQFTITSQQLVSSVRVSLYQYDYTYQITAMNTGPDADTADCAATSTTANTIVRSGNLTFGNMPSGSSATSSITLVLRQDRRYAFSWSNLQWQWSSVPVPSLTSVSPSTAYVGGGGFTLTVNGANFVSGDTVEWNNSGVTTTFVSRTQLTAIVPAGDIATQGTASVTVVNPVGGTSNSISLVISPPPVVQAQYNQGAAVTSTISPSGGTISVATPAGQATLTIPENALIDSTDITVTPITALSGAPVNGFTWLAGLQLEPQGLQFLQPVTLTFQLPSSPNPANTAAFVFQDDGTRFYQDISFVNGNVARIQLLHFTDYGVGSFNCSGFLAANPSWTAQELAREEVNYQYYCVSDPTLLREDNLAIMTAWFNASVLPGLQNVTDVPSLEAAVNEFLAWVTEEELLVAIKTIGFHDLDTLEASGASAIHAVLASLDAEADKACSCAADPTKKQKLMNDLISIQKVVDILGIFAGNDEDLIRTTSSLCQPFTAVTFQEPGIILQVDAGENLDLFFNSGQIPPGATVQWTSSLPAVADVTSNPYGTFVMGESPGQTNLNVAVTQCVALVTGSIPVTVNPRTTPCQPLAPLKLLQSNLTLTVDQTVSVSQVLDSSQLPAGTVVQWQSSHPGRVSVIDGMITASWPGPPVTLTVIANSECGPPVSATVTVTVNPVQPTAVYTLTWSARMSQDDYYVNGNHYSTDSNWSGTATFDSTGKCLSVSTEGTADLVQEWPSYFEMIFTVTGPGSLPGVLEILPISQDEQGPYMFDPLFYVVVNGQPFYTLGAGITDVAASYVVTDGTNTSTGDSLIGLPFVYVGPNVLRPDFATGTIFSKNYESTDDTTGTTTSWKVSVTVQPQQ